MIPKFRAWDDINEKMIYDFYREKIEKVDGWYKGELVVRNKNEIHCDLLYSSKEEYLFRHVKELPLMQSTSLKDKNGVEIFEGDIGWDDHQEVHGQVIFENGAFKYEWENISEDLFEVTD
ncbi:YopX family protein, partial [Enterococcus faecalis]